LEFRFDSVRFFVVMLAITHHPLNLSYHSCCYVNLTSLIIYKGIGIDSLNLIIKLYQLLV